MSETVLEIWTDGACKFNPGPGGWGRYTAAVTPTAATAASFAAARVKPRITAWNSGP